MFSVFYQQDLTKALFIIYLFMQRVLQVPCNGRLSLLSLLAKKGGSVGNTRLLPHAKKSTVLQSTRVSAPRTGAATRDEPLRTSAWEATGKVHKQTDAHGL